jgi:glycosyltransferase involved in cell wall biosynthesis
VPAIDGSIGLRRLLQWVAVFFSVVRHVCLRVKSPGDVVRLLRQASRLIASEGLRGLQVRAKCSAAILGKGKAGEGTIYAQWVSLYDTPTDSNLEAMRQLERDFDRRPLISVVMPVYNAPANFLCAAIDSLLAQTYPNWELCIADDCSTAPHVRKVLSAYAQKDARIHIVFRDHNGHISNASNSALALARGEWVALLDHDDTLPPHALFYVVAAINAQPDVKLIYSDEDKIDAEARRHSPYFKPDWNVDLFLSHNMFSHLGVYRADLIREVGGFRTGFEGSQDYDLALRCVERVQSHQICHIPRVLYHWRTLPGSTSVSTYEKSYAVAAGERALNEHLARTRPGAHAQFVGRGYRVRYSLPSPAPLVSLIIPTRNGRTLLEQCLTSIRRLTDYPNYEILVVDNGSDDRSTLAYLEALKAPGFRVLRDDRPFNYSALNNGAVSVAKGSVLALVNSDIEVISGCWLAEMVAIAVQDRVGALGARLWYPDERLQHGGIVLGMGGVAGHAHKFLGRGEPGYCCRAALQQSFSAVTAACLVVRKDRYLEVGGMDDVNLAVAFNDVDFCLKLLEAGYRNVWTPHAELYHHESASRGEDRTPEQQRRFRSEVEYMQRRWGHLLTHDRAYNPNLTLDRDDFSLAFPPRVPPFVDLFTGDGHRPAVACEHSPF